MVDEQILRLEKLRVETITGRVLVDDVDVELKRGEIAALVYTPATPNRLFTSIPPNSGLHLLQLPVSDALLDTYVPAKFTHADYPSLVPEGEEVQTWAVPVLLTAYNWPVGTARYNSLAAFTDLFFSRLPELQQPPFQENCHEVNIWATVPGWTYSPLSIPPLPLPSRQIHSPLAGWLAGQPVVSVAR